MLWVSRWMESSNGIHEVGFVKYSKSSEYVMDRISTIAMDTFEKLLIEMYIHALPGPGLLCL